MEHQISLILPGTEEPGDSSQAFFNPFQLADLLIFDEANMGRILEIAFQKITAEGLGECMQDADPQLVQRIQRTLSATRLDAFLQGLHFPLDPVTRAKVRRVFLDSLFWELTYWKTPDLYEELTRGERLHPGIFEQLEPFVRGKVVLDAGAGSGRASLEAIRHGAEIVYAVEPSPGLMHLLEQKVSEQNSSSERIQILQGDFAHLPLPDQSVDITISCAAFTAKDEQGGEPGLAELLRVTRRGGRLVLIWPRFQDHSWLVEHGFQYVVLPGGSQMKVHFSSLPNALRCAHRFYARNEQVLHYLLSKRQPEVPFSVLGFNPPCNYCWYPVGTTQSSNA